MTTADLAARRDFILGSATVSPSRRSVTGPGGAAEIEPRVMQVLVVLADHAGEVVTRETLFRRCWGGVYVGDDSLNRAVSAVRKIAADVGSGSFQVETVPRTGYRLVGDLRPLAPSANAHATAAKRVLNRRAVLFGAAAVAAAGTAVGGFWWSRRKPNAEVDALLAQGDQVFRDGTALEHFGPVSNDKLLALFEQAVRIEPTNAKAWGFLAYFRSAYAESVAADRADAALSSAQEAIRRALALDPREPHALTALLLLEAPMLDWKTRDRRLRDIIALDQQNIPALTELMALLQAVGLTRESWGWNEKILAIAPFSRPHLVIRAMKLWILGQIAASDKVIDRVRGLWPTYPFGYAKRMMLFALTGRPRAARAMIDSAPNSSWIGPPGEIAIWKAALPAIETGRRADIDRARDACLDAARKSPENVNNIVMILGAIGEADAAFAVTEGFLLWRGKLITSDQSNGRLVNDYSRKMTQWLFTPPLATMRTNPRFMDLCAEFGLVDYWRSRQVEPDFLKFRDQKRASMPMPAVRGSSAVAN